MYRLEEGKGRTVQLRLLTGPVRRRWRRALHGSMLRGQLRVETCKMLGRGMLADIDHELRRALSVEAQQEITELRTRAEEETQNLLLSMQMVLHLRLREGESNADRMDTGVGMYLRWYASMERYTQQARSIRRGVGGTPLRMRDRIDLKKDIAAIATVAGEVTLLIGKTPGTSALGLMWLAGAVLLLSELAFGTGCLVNLFWVAAGILGIWQSEAIGEWAQSARVWLIPGGLLLVAAMGLLAAGRRVRAPATASGRNPYEW